MFVFHLWPVKFIKTSASSMRTWELTSMRTTVKWTDVRKTLSFCCAEKTLIKRLENEIGNTTFVPVSDLSPIKHIIEFVFTACTHPFWEVVGVSSFLEWLSAFLHLLSLQPPFLRSLFSARLCPFPCPHLESDPVYPPL